MDWVQRHMKPMFRCEAECNPDFKQVIPYVLIEHRPTGRIFMTTRIGGDDRLVGQHSIGLGGHVDAGEGVADCLYRELNEEIGLAKVDIAELAFCGFIFKEDNEVDSVHLGMVFHAQTDRGDVACLEKEKLTGGWFTRSELPEARENGHMESWSALCFDHLLRKEGTR